MEFSTEIMEKIEVIDRLINAFSREELLNITEREEVVSKLQGKDLQTRPLTDFILEHNKLRADYTTLQGEVFSLRNDIRQVVAILIKPYDYQSTNDINSLKSRFGVY